MTSQKTQLRAWQGPMGLTPNACKAMRAWLGWKQTDLAKLANISPAAIADFERGAREPWATTRAALLSTFEAFGIELIYDEKGPIGLIAVAKPE